MSSTNKTFIVAELSANHNGDLQVALDTITAAKECGADAIKLQTYTADSLTIDSKKEHFMINNGTAWDGKYLYDLYQGASTPWEWHQQLFDHAKSIDLVCFSSPFDFKAVDLLEELGNPIYKIASFEIQDIPLIKYAASKMKPMVISTGIANYEDIQLAIDTIRRVGNEDITVLKCTSAYPAAPIDANLRSITDLQERFGVKVGLSDHTLGILAPVLAVSLGAVLIEKHFILDKSIGGPDAHFSLDKAEFAEMVKNVRLAEEMLGIEDFQRPEKKANTAIFSRSLFITEDVKAGEELTAKNVRSIRPGYGMHPKHYEEVLGKTANKDLTKGTPLSFDDID